MKKASLWIGATVIFLLTMILIFLLWGDRIMFWAAPKTVLASALTETYTQLEEQFQYSLLGLADHYIDPDGNYSLKGSFQFPHKLLGSVYGDMDLHIRLKNHQIAAYGKLEAADFPLALELYMDDTFFAANLKEMTKNQYFGITYETFLEDVQNIPLVGYFIPKSTLTDWNRSVQKIQKTMCWDYREPAFKNFEGISFEQLRLGILALPCTTEKRRITIDGNSYDCQTVTYEISNELLKKYMPEMHWKRDRSVTISFYLFDKKLIKLKADIENVHIDAELGINREDNIIVRYIDTSNETLSWTLSIETEQAAEIFSERWQLEKAKENSGSNLQLYSQYNLATQVWTVTLANPPEQADYTLAETNTGLRIRTERLDKILNLLMDNEILRTIPTISCDTTVQPGADVDIPEYQNIDKWSIEDLWNLVSSIGKLVGIQIAQ